MKTETLMNLLDQMIDDRCDMYGFRNTIAYLKDCGLTQDEITSLGFDVPVVQEVFDEADDVAWDENDPIGRDPTDDKWGDI